MSHMVVMRNEDGTIPWTKFGWSHQADPLKLSKDQAEVIRSRELTVFAHEACHGRLDLLPMVQVREWTPPQQDAHVKAYEDHMYDEAYDRIFGQYV